MQQRPLAVCPELALTELRPSARLVSSRATAPASAQWLASLVLKVLCYPSASRRSAASPYNTSSRPAGSPSSAASTEPAVVQLPRN